MEKFRKLKSVTRAIVPMNVRCHRRRVFFERLFEPLKEVRDRHGNHVSGYITHDMSSFRYTCHEMAGEIPFYPFDKEYSINIGNFFAQVRSQPFYKELHVKIVRISPLWKIFFGRGMYRVFVFGTDREGNDIRYNYKKAMKLFGTYQIPSVYQ